MKTILVSIITFYSINTFATPELNTNLSSLTDDVLNVGSAPSLDDCNCDGEDDTPKKKREKKPLISFSFGIEADGNGNRSVSSYDCSTSPVLGDIQHIANLLPTMDRDTYKQYLEANTTHFSAEDKICLANEFGDLGNDNYTMDDGIGFYTLDEMHSCIQQSQLGNYESCRTCAPIHHYTADMIESMGGQCGLMVNQSAADDYDPTTWAVSGNSRFMHYVNICKIGDKYHMINYSSNYQLEAMSYQDAVDIANIGLAEGNWAGNQITCMGSGKSSLADCSHVYLSRTTRYQLSKVQDAISQLDDNQAPMHVALTNLSQEIRVAVPLHHSTKRKVQKDGDVSVTESTHGLVAGYDRYRGEHFAQAGYVHRSQTKVSDSSGLKRESTQSFYAGAVGSSGDGAFNITGGDQSYSSMLLYLDRDDKYHLDENDDLVLSYDAVVGSDFANITRFRDNAGLGQTNVVTASWQHQFSPTLESEVSQQFSIMTDRANLPMPQIGQTTVSLNQRYFAENPSIDLTNETSVHFLHGGLKDETFAFQNATQLTASALGPSKFSLGVRADMGYTTESVMGKDIFYTEGFWGEGNVTFTQPIIQSGNRNLYLQVDGGVTTGSRPSQFGLDPLTIEQNPTRGMINSGYNGWIKIGGQF